MSSQETIGRLQKFKRLVSAACSQESAELRSAVNQEKAWVKRQVVDAGCMKWYKASAPPGLGLPSIDVDPFDAIFERPYGLSIESRLLDMIDETIGALINKPLIDESPPEQTRDSRGRRDIQKNVAFIAMPMDRTDPLLDDVLDAVKDTANRLGIRAERIDEPASSERVTDRILASIRSAEYVIVDLTYSKPNVYYEAGYAQGVGKTPIFLARDGTEIGFDLKDYPVIFFANIRQLKIGLEKRLLGLMQQK